jgi:photosystem II stability/assembly factor-like uncharacterized protein
MNKLAISLVLIFSAQYIIAQWVLQNPYPQPYNLHDVYFIDNQTGWAAGDNGTMIKTTDGGNTWDVVNSGTNNSLTRIFFTNINTGWAVGDSGCIINTADGGNSWTPQSSGTVLNIADLYFYDYSKGWAIGNREDYINNGWELESILLKTTNGGVSWDTLFYDTTIAIRSIHFLNETEGWAVGSKPDTTPAIPAGIILYTDDGGYSWNLITTLLTSGLNDISFTDSNNGWAVGSCIIAHTGDGGGSWEIQFTTGGPGSGGPYFKSLCFADNQNGYVAGTQGGFSGFGTLPTIYYTTDGGLNWGHKYFYGYAFSGLAGVSFPDPENGWLVGFSYEQSGMIQHTFDGGLNWESQSGVNTFINLRDIHFVDQYYGWAVGSHPTLPTLAVFMYTDDGGNHWLGEFWPSMYGSLNGIFFVDDLNGWLIGYTSYSSCIRYTPDGGSSWINQFSWTYHNIIDIFFIDLLHGWAVGGGGVPYEINMLRTVDGGNYWEIIDFGSDIPLSSVYFNESNYGWAVGGEGTIIHTSDGGDTWDIQSSGVNHDLLDVCFADSQNGWVVGGYLDPYEYSAIILHTSDGGNTWDTQLTDTNFQLNSLSIGDINNCWVVGRKEEGGIILYTDDGGITWEEQSTSSDQCFSSVCFTDLDKGWIAGDDGTILHTDNGGTTGINKTMDSYDHIKAYPNPATDIVTINYEFEIKEEVILSIYNIRGQEIEHIPLGITQSGNYKFDCKEFLTGIYFITLRTTSEILTEKLLIK